MSPCWGTGVAMKRLRRLLMSQWRAMPKATLPWLLMSRGRAMANMTRKLGRGEAKTMRRLLMLPMSPGRAMVKTSGEAMVKASGEAIVKASGRATPKATRRLPRPPMRLPRPLMRLPRPPMRLGRKMAEPIRMRRHQLRRLRTTMMMTIGHQGSGSLTVLRRRAAAKALSLPVPALRRRHRRGPLLIRAGSLTKPVSPRARARAKALARPTKRVSGRARANGRAKRARRRVRRREKAKRAWRRVVKRVRRRAWRKASKRT
mmetsp:Transcript_28906/g.63205  ORF Transcript_28906/g.63205 Transcript_28906/m.63205 type:complete len:260 (+) Transcript_28906:559-1338(+)